MNDENIIIEDMKKLGLTNYEAKAYLKLLEEYPVNGYVLSKNSSVPRSRIYEVLESLKNKGIVFEKITEDSTQYYPLDPKLLISKLRDNYNQVFLAVEDYTVNKYNKENEEDEILVIKGRRKTIEFIKNLINQAESRVALSIWDEELKEISPELKAIKEKGVSIRGIYFGKDDPLEDIIPHRRVERYLSEKKQRYIIVIVDSKYVVSGIISRGEDSRITWSKDPSLIDISDDYIAHDIMINKYSMTLTGEDRDVFERELDELRKCYFCFSDDEYKQFKA